ncbi:hypothetical protein [Halomarina ordinaria]|uniref:Uncharacterized protein n=1 Tax=Halomarina ordinaria TaxID=3033939 RepID=A0ABD5UGW8_9EURY|nr:hypothetical protein [Halomarina sp. PSRA2]
MTGADPPSGPPAVRSLVAAPTLLVLHGGGGPVGLPHWAWLLVGGVGVVALACAATSLFEGVVRAYELAAEE